MESKIEWDGTSNLWGRRQRSGLSSSTWADGGKRAERSTAGTSVAWRSWKRASNCWWHRPPGLSCNGIA